MALLFVMSFCSEAPREKPDAAEVSVCFTGDVMLDRGVRKRIDLIGMDSLFSGVAPLFRNSDFTVINLECPATDTIHPKDKSYDFRADPEWLPFLKKAGVTHACLANNHSSDQDEGGLLSTIGNLERCGIPPFGAGADSAACSPVRFQKNNVRFIVFGSVPLYLDYARPDTGGAGPCILSAEALADRIGEAGRSDPGAFIIAVLHWGREYQTGPSPRQRADARLLIDAGADAVVGHHPHVLQPVEAYRGRPIFYSLGNLVFDQKDSLTRQSMMVRMGFASDSLQSVELLPVVIDQCAPLWADSTDSRCPAIRPPGSDARFKVSYHR
jgi:poly-gamma-glutamate capsule biosynthesis protein CapA/YwtB (metallophosphatase superfamily)